MTYTRILLLIGVLKMPAHSKIKNANKIYSSIIPVICVRLSCDYTRYADLPQTTIEYHKVSQKRIKYDEQFGNDWVLYVYGMPFIGMYQPNYFIK